VLYLRTNSTPGFEATYDKYRHLQVAVLGSGLSVLAAAVLWLLLAGKARAVDLARSMTADLERMAVVARRTSNAVMFADLNWRITWVNEGFTRITGYMAHEALGCLPAELLASPELDTQSRDQLAQATVAGRSTRVVLRNRRKSGEDYWAEVEIQPLRDSNGRATGYMSIQSDISAEVQAKADLLREKERADTILSGTNVGTWESNLITGESQWNERWGAMMGYSHDEVLPNADQFWQSHLHPDDRARLNNELEKCKRGEVDSYTCDVRVLRKDGSWMWVSSRANVMARLPDGRVEWIGGIHTDITAAKQVELDLRDMEAFLDRAGRIAGVGAWQINLKTGAVHLSAQTCDIYGKEPGWSPSLDEAMAFYAPHDRERVLDAMKLATEFGRAWDIVVEFFNARGEQLWVRLFGEVEFDDSGAVRLVGAFQDVTRDRAAQAALADEQNRLQSILQGTRVGTWEWNVQTGQRIFNEQYARMLGHTLESLGSDPSTWPSLVHPADLAEAQRRLNAHVQGLSDFYEMEMRMRHRDGRWIWVLARGKLVHSTEDGLPLWVYGTHLDISESKSAAQRLAQTMATLQNVLDSATNVGVISTGLDRVIQVFNRGAENLLGYSAEEALGQLTMSRFFDLNELALLHESMELMLGRQPSTQEVFDHVAALRDQQEWTLVRKDGTRFKANLIFSPMRDENGELSSHLAILYDISKQKEYEESLRAAMHLAEQSSVAKSQFLANMSHEIRTPMNAILGMLQLLNQTALDTRQRDYSEKAQGAARSLLGLLNDILDFSKVEAGKMQLDPQPFVLEDLLGDLSVILASNLGNRDVDLVFDLDPALPRELLGDALRLKQILINLGGNAVKFTEHGEIVIACTLQARSAERVKLALSVRDTGIGIAPENQARIFEAFTQAEASTTRRFGGTGLGLVICTRLIALMGGELTLRSAVGQGSTFSFTLDLPLLAEVNAPVAQPDAPALRVLLVDDNATARACSASLMQSLGWSVTQAPSGESALAALQAVLAAGEPPYDAYFVDLQMPRQDGQETLRQLRQMLPPGNAAPRLLLSRHSGDARAGNGAQAPDLVDGVLVKPLTAGAFARALAQARSSALGVAALTPAGQEAGARAQLASLRGLRLLLVEDNLINQQVARELLEHEGAHVVVADNGQLGLDALYAPGARFDAVLMDLQMPVMDGLSATRLLRDDARFADLPVIAMTANAMAADREDCLAAGMNDHVGKPFDIRDLVQVLLRWTHWVPQPDDVGAPARAAPDARADDGLSAPGEAFAGALPQGLDLDAALSRMGGNRRLLARAMEAFVAECSGLAQRLQGLRAQGDAPALQRELHALKGLSATLGASALSQQAAHCERLAHASTQDEALDQGLRGLALELASAQAELPHVAQQLAGPPRDGGARRAAHGSPDAASLLLEPLRALHQALQDSDMRALHLFEEVHSAAADDMLPQLEALQHAMQALDFARAAQECAPLIALCTPDYAT